MTGSVLIWILLVYRLKRSAMKKRRQEVEVVKDPKTNEKFLKIRLTNAVRRQLAPLKGKNSPKKK